MKQINKYQNRMAFAALPFLLFSTMTGQVENNLTIYRLSIACYLLATLLCGLPIVYRAIMGLRWRTIGIELLVTIAVCGALVIGEYSECAIVTFLFQFGNYLERRTLKKTRSAIKELVESAPQTALRKSGDDWEELEAEDVEEGDLLLIREGDKAAVDGIVSSGEGYFNEAGITGESRSVHKKTDDFIYAGSILETGLVEMTAQRVGEDTTYARIIELVEEAQDAKSPVERFIDRFARYYTPFVILAATITLLCTRDIDTSVTVLVLACPGALVIGAPIASVSGIGKGARKGILYKGGDVIHTFARCDTFLFDKTGTLTEGNTRVSSCHPIPTPGKGSDHYLHLAADIERHSSHPLGKALVDFDTCPSFGDRPQRDIQTIKGMGMTALAEGERILVGNEKLLETYGVRLDEKEQAMIRECAEKGESPVLIAAGEHLVAVLGISDTIRKQAERAIATLSRQSRVMMLTGDKEESAKAVASQLGIREVRHGMLPEDKYELLCKLQKEGRRVCFVGDGINDSPAITKADVGISMGSGTDVAIECSDIVLLSSDPNLVPEAQKLARRIVAITRQNIVLAVGTVLLLLLGLMLGYIHMSIGMLIHELSILAVIANGMRLLADHRE